MSASFSDLKKKIILITGATRGIGREVACTLAEQEAHVVFNYREGKKETASELAVELRDRGASEATPLLFDVTDNKQMSMVLTDFAKKHPPISGLVNNAGVTRDQILLWIKEEDLKKTIDTNLIGPILVAKALARGFLRSKNASIVNVGSVVGLMGNAGQIGYSSSKSGLVGLTKSLAKELSSRNVRCNAICPGFIETAMTDTLDSGVRHNYLSRIPLERFGHPREIANLVAFLLSSASSYITGEVIKIDGGLYI